ncbi:MAG: anthranilate phosphoribosyltransferase [Chitinophagaceae bacterium]|nr:anthranilate phosphoribosyltransferase [Chitinophagaceae bacterium]
MKKILQSLFEYKSLSRQQAYEILLQISNGIYNEHEITAFMTVYLMRSVTIDELLGFRDALLELCLPFEVDSSSVIDIVGTGGDGKNTFNVSTLACFVVAGAGKKVVKHGNYGASSVSGASNVMEQIGYKLKNNTDDLKKELDKANFCFLHAPMFHPALKTVGPIRRNLGMRTFFNMLGPLVNPARPGVQLIGVYNLEMARIYNYILQQSTLKYTIVHSLDGYDEISLTNDTKVISPFGEQMLSPMDLGKRMVSQDDIYGGDTVAEAASIFMKILNGKGTWAQNAVVLANAAMALFTTGDFTNYEESYQMAVESLESGKAFQTFQQLIALQ